MSRTVIIGAGVIGLACGWELCKRGEEVLIVERGEPGAACSAGNAGWIVPSISTPLPAPGLIGTSLRWMLRRDSPLYIKPRVDPRFGAWLAGFWRHCRSGPFARGVDALIALNARTMALFDQLTADGVEFEMHHNGLLFVGLSRDVVEHAAAEVALLEQGGYRRPTVLSGAEVRELEPGLSHNVAGGFLVEEERHVRPETLTAGLAERLLAAGADIRSGVEVRGVERRAGRLTALLTSVGSIAADRVVIAAGAWSGEVAGRIGFRLPIEAGKGYSITIERPKRSVTRPLDLIEARVAVTPFAGSLRLAGTMELSGLNLRIEPTRVEAIRRAGRRYLGNMGAGASEQVWVGMRPLTPDGLPLIGRVDGTENTYVATGHQMLGVTLAPATAVALSELILDGASGLDLQPFAPGRFRGAALASHSKSRTTHGGAHINPTEMRTNGGL